MRTHGPNLCISAAVQYGQLVERHWTFSDSNGGLLIDDSDKHTVKENLLQCLYQAQESKIIKQYTRSLKVIVRADYPMLWESFVDQCMHFVNQ